MSPTDLFDHVLLMSASARNLADMPEHNSNSPAMGATGCAFCRRERPVRPTPSQTPKDICLQCDERHARDYGDARVWPDQAEGALLRGEGLL